MTRLLGRTNGSETAGGETPETARDDGPDAPEATGTTGGDENESTGEDPTDSPAASGGDENESTGEDPTDSPAASGGDESGPTDTKDRRSGTAWRRVALAAALTALLLGGSGFFHAAHQLRSTPSARNQALTDAEATTRVSGDVSEGLARVFSYTAADTGAAERSARNVLAGRAARQYVDLLAQVRVNLVEQRITLSTQAVRTAVIELDGDSARLLVFLDQTSRRDKAAATSAAAQLTVTAKYQGDRWLIVDIEAR
ncbi:hypothetical protein ACN9M0_01035 [Streptomyces sp. R-07]|uniref:hypothetical protein n=1 Tax=Streptomyces sp. R-07 TaxID=3404052 RepID=UPI003CF5B4EB